MIRHPLESAWSASPTTPDARRLSPFLPTFRRFRGMAPAGLLLLGGLLAAGCGEVAEIDQHVPESFASGERPAPLSKAELAAAKAELPPAPPAEPTVEPTPAAKDLAAETRGTTGKPGQGAAGHLRLSGTYRADAGAIVTCAILAGRGLQLTFDSAQSPLVEILVGDFLGAGRYVAEARVLARDTPHTERLAAGEARVEIRIAEVDRPRLTSFLSGTFTGAYAGQAVEGEVSGSFDRCAYGGLLP
jgi:hypothetical protein